MHKTQPNTSSLVPVSVVVPCYNAASTIERAVTSVITQTARPSELILIDDASCDSEMTLSALHALQQSYDHLMRIKIIRMKDNHGPAAARNAGWDAATQPFLAFLDADDAWHPAKIDLQYSWMKDHPSVAITGHPCIWMQPGQEIPSLPTAWDVREVNGPLLLFSNRFQTPSVMLQRQLPFRFREGMNYCEDYLLWLQAVLRGHRAFRFGLPLAFLYKPPYGAGGLSRDLWALTKGELAVCRILRHEGLIGGSTRSLLVTYILLKHIRRLGISIASGRLSATQHGNS